MGTETSKNNLNPQSSQIEESTSEVNEVTVITKESVSYSLENDNPNQNKKLTECIESQNSLTRIYLVRHLPYKECPEYSLYEDIRDKLKEKLTKEKIHKYLEEKYGDFYNDLIKDFEQEKNPIKSLFSMLDDSLCTDSSILDPNLYESIFQDQKNTILIHNPIDSSKERIKQSVNYIKTSYPDINFQEENIVGSQKGIDKQLAVMKAGKELVEIIVDIKSEISLENSSLKGKNIVILGSRTHSHFLNVKKFDANGKDKSENEFEEKGYDFIELDDNLDIIDDTSKLIINPENYKDLKKLFPNINSDSITDFQNKVDAHFIENPKLYEKYLLSDNIDLRAFCIANLIKNNKGIELIKIYYNNINKPISEKEEEILWKNKINSQIPSILANLVKNNLLQNPIIKEQFQEFVKILNIQSRSLDSKIKNQESDGILDRKLFLVEKVEKNKTDGKGEKKIEYINQTIDISSILSSNDKYIIPAYVGNGKSIWITEFVKNIILNYPNYKVHFFEGSDFNGDNKINNLNSLKKLLEISDNKSIIFIDAIDEINDDEIKKQIKELLQNTKSKIIITGRPSEYNDKENTGFKTLGFMPFSKEEFINSRIQDKNKKQEILKFIETSNLSNEIEGNPLLLNFVCILANLDEEKKEHYKKFSIKSLENIQNKTDLYESISRLIIYEHNKSKGINLGEEEIDSAMNKLGESAYNLSDLKNLKISDTYLKKLNILFKKSEIGDYKFIHKSFYEFFLARHFVNQPNGNEEIYKIREDNKDNWNEWRNSKPIVLFYGEILTNSNKTDNIEDLLNGLLIDDDIFGEGFFMGLEILHKLEGQGELSERFLKIKEKYKEEIKGWDKEIILYRLGLFQKLQKRINFGKNRFVDKFFEKLKELFGEALFGEGLFEGTKEIYNLDFDFESCNLPRRNRIYNNDFFNIGNQENINGLMDIARDYENGGFFKLALFIYVKLFFIGKNDILGLILNCIRNLEEQKEFDCVILKYIHLISFNGNKEVIISAMKFIRKFIWENDENNYKENLLFFRIIYELQKVNKKIQIKRTKKKPHFSMN